MTNEEAYSKLANLRIYVLQCVLELINDKKFHKFSTSDIKGLSDRQVSRCLGDLSKAIPLYCQFTESFDAIWTINQPSISNMAKALYIARTGGDCTSWNPED